MKPFRALLICAFVMLFSICGAAQETLPADETAPLVLVRIIPIPGVEGRFDHMAVDNKAAASSPPFMATTAWKS